MSRANPSCKLKPRQVRGIAVEFTTEMRCNDRGSLADRGTCYDKRWEWKGARGGGGRGRKERCRGDIQGSTCKRVYKGEYLLAFSRDDKAPRLLCTAAAALRIRDSPIPLDSPPPPPLSPRTTTDALSISASTTLSSSFFSYPPTTAESLHLGDPRSALSSDIPRYVFSLTYMQLHYRTCIGNWGERERENSRSILRSFYMLMRRRE